MVWKGGLQCDPSIFCPTFTEDIEVMELNLNWLKLQQDSARCRFRTWLVVENQASLQLSLQLVYLASQCQPSDRKLDISSLRRGEWTRVDSRFRWISQLRVFFFGKALLGELIFTFTLSYVVLCVAVSSITKAGSPTTSCI